jgi:hypothetical protein
MAILFVYDVTNIQSFENLDDWVQFAKKLWAQMEKVKAKVSPFQCIGFSHFIWDWWATRQTVNIDVSFE